METLPDTQEKDAYFREVSTRIHVDLYTQIKLKGYKFNQLLKLGFESAEGNTPILERVNILETTQARKIANVAYRLQLLEQELEGIKQQLSKTTAAGDPITVAGTAAAKR